MDQGELVLNVYGDSYGYVNALISTVIYTDLLEAVLRPS